MISAYGSHGAENVAYVAWHTPQLDVDANTERGNALLHSLKNPVLEFYRSNFCGQSTEFRRNPFVNAGFNAT